MVRPVEIAGHAIGPGQRCFVIAEAGVNHNGQVDLAKRLIDAAADAGADAVKFQTFIAERLVTHDAPKAQYQREATGGQESQFEMLRRLELSKAMHKTLQAHCQERGILFLSTPFDESSADFLETLGVPAFKIPSGEVTNLPFLSHVARKRTPVILSTGMCTLADVEQAVQTIREASNRHLILLHCVSHYPADPAEANLRAIQTMQRIFKVPVGYSDHTLGVDVALAAVALGACVIEKHITLDRTLPGPDHRVSAEPDELAALVRGIRTVEASLGHGRKELAPSEHDVMAAARKSLVAARNIPRGSRLTEEAIAIKRPGTGLPPAMRAHLVGRIAARDISAGTLLSWEMVTEAPSILEPA